MRILYFHADRNGMPTELTDADGKVQWSARNDAWGKGQVVDGTSGSHQPLRFQGQYFDAETGLHYNQHRYYDPEMGRFTTQDPIGLRGGVNPYRHVPNPLGWADPLGLQGAQLVYSGSPLFTGFAQVIPSEPHWFDVVAGSSNGVPRSGTSAILPPRMAQDIRNSPHYRRGQSVMLYACNAGRALAGMRRPYAQRLADYLGEDVYAPTDALIRNLITGNAEVVNGGIWRVFHPTPITQVLGIQL